MYMFDMSTVIDSGVETPTPDTPELPDNERPSSTSARTESIFKALSDSGRWMSPKELADKTEVLAAHISGQIQRYVELKEIEKRKDPADPSGIRIQYRITLLGMRRVFDTSKGRKPREIKETTVEQKTKSAKDPVVRRRSNSQRSVVQNLVLGDLLEVIGVLPNGNQVARLVENGLLYKLTPLA